MYPDFIGIGAQKAGTTWLHRNLHVHPQVWMNPIKEVHYFNRKINERPNVVFRLFGRHKAHDQWRRQAAHWVKRSLVDDPSLEDLRWVARYFAGSYGDSWYASIFEPGRGRVTGEITPAYSTIKREMVAHVYEIMPDTKIIFFMRSPIERVWSQTVMGFDKAQEGSAKSMPEKKLLKKLERESPQLLTSYGKTLETWGEFYPPEQVFVGFLEDIHFFPEEMLRGVYEFLGVDPSFKPLAPQKKVHSRSVGRMPTKFATELARRYREELIHLQERFGGYASYWLYCADRLIESPPEEDYIPYPLYESSMWEDWVNGSENHSEAAPRYLRLQSGALAAVQAIK